MWHKAPRLLTLLFLLASWPGREGPREAFCQDAEELASGTPPAPPVPPAPPASSGTEPILGIRYVDQSGPPDPLPEPQLVGQSHAMEYVPAQNLDYLRPAASSVDAHRAACELPAGSGKYTGVCTRHIQEANSMMAFCGDLVRYRACVPAQQAMWPNWNASKKDQLLADLFKDMVEKRIAREMNVTPDLYVPIHYLSNPKCVNALRNALCWFNFPKCDDQNRSLPLCESTCKEYYSNCQYEKNDDGHFPHCSGRSTAKKGLFGSGVTPGSDQVLASFQGTCSILASDQAMGIVPEEKSLPFYQIWWIMLLIVVGGLIVLLFLAYALIPPVLMEFLIKSLKKFLRLPLTCWRRIPTFAGKTLLIVLGIICVVALSVGFWRIVSAGWNRWKEETTNTGGTQFKPPQYIWGTQAATPLTNTQLKQLRDSCTCTGIADRGLPTLAILILIALSQVQVSFFS